MVVSIDSIGVSDVIPEGDFSQMDSIPFSEAYIDQRVSKILRDYRVVNGSDQRINLFKPVEERHIDPKTQETVISRGYKFVARL